MSNDMTKPLKDMTEDQLRSSMGIEICSLDRDSYDAAFRIVDELARRLAEAERRLDRYTRISESGLSLGDHLDCIEQLERMKPVVDAAQRANQSLFVDWDDLDNLKDKVRQYEEGK